MATNPPPDPVPDLGFSVTIESLRKRIGLAQDDASRDNDIAAAWQVSLSLIELYLDRKLEFLPDEETFYSRGTSILVRRWPIMEGSAVVKSIGEDDTQRIQFDHHSIDYFKGIIYLNHFGNVSVKYEGGLVTVPADLLWVFAQVFDTVWSSDKSFGGSGASVIQGSGAVKKVSLVGIGSVDLDVGSTVVGGGGGSGASGGSPWAIFPATLISILDRYRRESAVGVG